jgi:hypothetical protein
MDQKYLEIFEMFCWRRIGKIVWTDRVMNGKVLHTVVEERNILHTIEGGRLNGLVTSDVGTAWQGTLLKDS